MESLKCQEASRIFNGDYAMRKSRDGELKNYFKI
jgi:hypothetical protein